MSSLTEDQIKDLRDKIIKTHEEKGGIMIETNGALKVLTLISEEDKDLCGDYKIFSHYTDTKKTYARIYVNKQGAKSLHSFLMGKQEGKVIDHIDGNGLNNRRDNLRFLTKRQNAENKVKPKGKFSSDFYGVSFKKNKYEVNIMIEGKRICLGYFDDEVEAAEIYDTYVVQNNLHWRPLNFPDKKDEYLKLPKIKIQVKDKPKFYGVSKSKSRDNSDYFFSSITIEGKQIYIKYSKDPNICAKAYDKFVVEKKLNKKLNYPDEHLNYEPDKQIKTLCEEIDEDTVKLIIKTDGSDVILDKDDYDKIKYYNCTRGPTGYVTISIDNKSYRLHRYIMNVTDDNVFVDHINRNRCDCRKSNLRLSNPTKNAQNRSKNKNSDSKYYGVSFDNSKNMWVVIIRKDRKYLFRKFGQVEENLARARDLYILKNLQDEHYPMNFEDWDDETINYWEKFLEQERKDLIQKDKVDNNRSSKYRGVSYNKKQKAWVIGIRFGPNEKRVHFQHKDEDTTGRWRDIEIMSRGIDIKTRDPCFDWNQEDLKKWQKVLKYNFEYPHSF